MKTAEKERKAIGLWLLACTALAWVVLVSGGVTRLTRSGLSIVEWKPVVGALPPLSRAGWEAEFEKYRRTPEYVEVNAGMSLEAYRSIYLMEYAHRLLGRLAGLAFVLPFLYLALKRRIDRALVARLSLVALLWGLQGALGWYMVASGLVDEPRVSHYRLTAHLLTACLLFWAMLSTALRLLRPVEPAQAAPPAWLRTLSGPLVALSLAAIASGGLVAGLKAGLLFDTFPRMGGCWIPPFLLEERPLARNFFENPITAQFDHRALAAVLALAALGSWLGALCARVPRRSMDALHFLAAAVVLQAALGALTLVHRVPVVLGAAHQGAALLVFGAALLARHELAAPRHVTKDAPLA